MEKLYINFDTVIDTKEGLDLTPTTYALNAQFKAFYEQFEKQFNIIIYGSENTQNNGKKKAFLQANLGAKFYDNNPLVLDKNSIQIDYVTSALETSAKIKILYKFDGNFGWQKHYENKNIFTVNNWKQAGEILSFFSLYNYDNLSKKGAV